MRGKKSLFLFLFITIMSVLTGCSLIDRAMIDSGIVKDENGNRRWLTAEERKEAEERGRLNVDFTIVDSFRNQSERVVKVAIVGDLSDVTGNDIRLISESIWLDMNKHADFSTLSILVYDRKEIMEPINALGTGVFTTKGKLSTEQYRSLQYYDFAWMFEGEVYTAE